MKSRNATSRLNVVWHDGRLIGELLHSGPIYFRYAPEWLATGHNLSPLKLVFDGRVVNCHGAADGVPGLISDALPDTWGRRVAESIFARAGLGRPTPFKLLAWVGTRGLGAVGFEPALGLPESGPTLLERIRASALAREARAVQEGDLDRLLPNLSHGMTGGGAQPKILVVAKADNTLRLPTSATPLVKGEKSCLLKLDVAGQSRHRVELAYLEMAARAGITTPSARLLTDENSRDHLLIERFDVGASGGKRHFHSLAGLLHRPPGDLDYADLFQATTRLGCPRTDLLSAARRMLFNLRAGNQDDHGKNHAFLYDEEFRTWHLAPAYDLTHSPGLDRGLRIAGEVVPRWSRLREWLADAGLRPAEIKQASEAVDEAIAAWPKIARKHSVPAAQITEITATHKRIAAQFCFLSGSVAPREKSKKASP